MIASLAGIVSRLLLLQVPTLTATLSGALHNRAPLLHTRQLLHLLQAQDAPQPLNPRDRMPLPPRPSPHLPFLHRQLGPAYELSREAGQPCSSWTHLVLVRGLLSGHWR